ncbi:MAG: TIGR03560 family F420-dependent LLM class oxidoreductase [Acidimicrobiia bacterium]|nr:TIGR03560 family F420-dependent LLM class oxidoreductase [Acidimicrobiia bacterium]
MSIQLPTSCLVILVGPSGAGKTTWADENFRPGQVVSSDRLRALVGEGEHDQRVSAEAFELLNDIVRRRLEKKLVTIIDTLGLDAASRAAWRSMADLYDVPSFAIGFDTDPALCRKRNERRSRKVPAKVLSRQLDTWRATRDLLNDEGFAGVFAPDRVRLVANEVWGSEARKDVPLEFGLQISWFDFDDSPASTADQLASIARRAEAAGFTSLWVMDHFRQIPQVGRPWQDMLESTTTLSYLAAVTETIKLGVLVSGVTYRNPALLGKIIATLDVLSNGRAMCGLGAGWFEAEHTAYGWDFPSVSERFELLEDTLELLPLLWGPGNPAYQGRRISVPEAMCYPRPLQDKIPILVGGSGERRTLRLVAQHADACNLFGDVATVRHKLEVLHRHCADVGRDPAEITVTHLAPALVAADDRDLSQMIDRLAPDLEGQERFIEDVRAGTIDDHEGRYAALAEAGVQTAIVSLVDAATEGTIETFGSLIERFG